MATFQLTYAAADWWESEKATLREEAIRGMTWATFKIKFLEKYFPMTERNDKRNEFLELVQGSMTVREYMTKFERLSHFAGNLIDTPEAKNQQYHQDRKSTRLNSSH